jgi:NADPH:quinone reductase
VTATTTSNPNAPLLPRRIPAEDVPIRSVVPRPAAGQLRLRPTLRGNGFVVGSVDANGPDTVGFANRDRVAWRDTSTELPDLLLLDQDDVLGVPGWITDEQVADFLGPGLIARALMRSSRRVGHGDDVRVVSRDPLVAAMAAAWARSLGARIVEQGPAVVIEATSAEPGGERRGQSSHGRLAQAAVEVFQAVRAGVFEGVDPATPRGGVTAA